MWLSVDAMCAGDYESGKQWSCSAFRPAPGRDGAPARFSVSEPWLFKRAPVVLITLSLGTHTDAGAHIRECEAALTERGKALARTQLLALMKCNRAGR